VGPRAAGVSRSSGGADARNGIGSGQHIRDVGQRPIVLTRRVKWRGNRWPLT
jgi:hypothetical protein